MVQRILSVSCMGLDQCSRFCARKDYHGPVHEKDDHSPVHGKERCSWFRAQKDDRGPVHGKEGRSWSEGRSQSRAFNNAHGTVYGRIITVPCMIILLCMVPYMGRTDAHGSMHGKDYHGHVHG